MKPIDPMEVSALVDGELTPQRAAEVRQAIARDAALREIYEHFTMVDADLNRYAAASTFNPRVRLSSAIGTTRLYLPHIVLALLAARLIVKLTPLGFGITLQAVILLALLAWIVARLVRLADDVAFAVPTGNPAGSS